MVELHPAGSATNRVTPFSLLKKIKNCVLNQEEGDNKLVVPILSSLDLGLSCKQC